MTTSNASGNVWAVGYDTPAGASQPQTLTLDWNGTAWTTVASPDAGSPSVLTSVSTNPGAAIVWAVGHSGVSGSFKPLVPETAKTRTAADRIRHQWRSVGRRRWAGPYSAWAGPAPPAPDSAERVVPSPRDKRGQRGRYRGKLRRFRRASPGPGCSAISRRPSAGRGVRPPSRPFRQVSAVHGPAGGRRSSCLLRDAANCGRGLRAGYLFDIMFE